jgi:hypothetical protein
MNFEESKARLRKVFEQHRCDNDELFDAVKKLWFEDVEELEDSVAVLSAHVAELEKERERNDRGNICDQLRDQVAFLMAAYTTLFEKYKLACAANEKLEVWSKGAEAVRVAAEAEVNALDEAKMDTGEDLIDALSICPPLETLKEEEGRWT